jgi:hypothetical protein
MNQVNQLRPVCRASTWERFRDLSALVDTNRFAGLEDGQVASGADDHGGAFAYWVCFAAHLACSFY